jgi:hypothetical protein
MKAVLAVFLTHFIHDPVDVMNPLRLQDIFKKGILDIGILGQSHENNPRGSIKVF